MFAGRKQGLFPLRTLLPKLQNHDRHSSGWRGPCSSSKLLKAGEEGPDLSLFRKLNVEDVAEGSTVLAHTEGCGAGRGFLLEMRSRSRETLPLPPTPTLFTILEFRLGLSHARQTPYHWANSQELSPMLLVWDRSSNLKFFCLGLPSILEYRHIALSPYSLSSLSLPIL